MGTSASVLADTQCEIPLATIEAAPYSLVQGDEVYAKVIATNFYGDSAKSPSGNGALVQVVPSAPVNL